MTALAQPCGDQDGVLFIDSPLSVNSGLPWRYTLDSEVVYVTGTGAGQASVDRGADDTVRVAHARGTELVAAPIPTGETGDIRWRGAWDAGTAYVQGDGVADGGVAYLCLAPNLNDEPPSANWEAIGSVATENLAATLTVGNDAAGIQIVHMGEPTDPEDAVTKAYVDGLPAPTVATVLASGNDTSGQNIVGTSPWSIGGPNFFLLQFNSDGSFTIEFPPAASLTFHADGSISDSSDVVVWDVANFAFRLNVGEFDVADGVSDGAPGKVGMAVTPTEAEYGAQFVWTSLVTVQTGTPVGGGLLTPLVYDNTAVTGGLYAWTGADYTKIGGLAT